MGQFCGRIHIKVKESKDWLKLKGLPEGLLNGAISFYWDIDEISTSNKTNIVLWGEGEVGFGDLNMGHKIDKAFDTSRVCDMCSAVKVLAEALGDSAVIVADSTYNGSDMSTSRVCYLGSNLKYEYFSWGTLAKLFDTTDINDIKEWLASGEFEISSAEKEYLRQFSINLDNYSSVQLFGMRRQIRIFRKNVHVVEPTMDKSSVKKIIVAHTDSIVGKVFVVTGKLYHFANRNELKSLIESNGAKLSETLNSSTDYLITNEPNSGSSKNLKAKLLGISIITEEDLLKLMALGEESDKYDSNVVDNTCTVAGDENERQVVKTNSGKVKTEQQIDSVKMADLILSKMGAGYVINGYKGMEQSFAIPEEISGIPIIGIGTKAFAENTKTPDYKRLKSIRLPSTLEFIDSEAFFGCELLEEVSICQGLKKVGADAFGKCKLLKKVLYSGDITAWCGIIFASSSKNSYFYSNPLSNGADLIINGKAVENLIVNGVSIINDGAFYGVKAKTVTLEDGVTTIGNSAFGYCKKLAVVNIPNSIQCIKGRAFRATASIKSVNFFGGISDWFDLKFEDEQSLPFNPKTKLFIGNEEVKNLIVPSNVSKVKQNAFYSYQFLEELTVREGVKSIENYAFAHCYALAKVIISKGVTNIGESAFCCCDNLISLTIPKTIKHVKNNAFYGCENLKNIVFEGTIEQWNAITFGNDWRMKVPAKTVTCVDGVLIL